MKLLHITLPVVALAASLAGPGPAWAQEWPQIELVPTISGAAFPVHIAHAGDGSGRVFVVELGGRIRIARNGVLQSTPFLDISGKVGCNQGLLSVTFPPDYTNKGHFYVNYTDVTTCALVIARYSRSANPDVADAASEQIVLSVPKPPEYPSPAIFHSGGELAFGPDGFLYVGIGDGDTGSAPGDALNLAQNLGSWRGKILRLDVETGSPATYTIPASNPFVTTPGARSEIWALGLRNPWRSAFDRLTGDFYVGDVGQNAYEEVNFQPAGSPGGLNYGWRIMEGSQCYDPPADCDPNGQLTLPVGGYVNTRPIDCSITGGRVYRGAAFPRMNGVYFYGDYCSGRIWGLRQQGGIWQSTLLRDQAAAGQPISSEGLVSFGEDEAGNLYVTDSRAGVIYMIVDNVAHSGDSDRNSRLSLLELTRVIELYNTRNGTTRTGAYKVDAAGEDGFAPDPARANNAVVTLPLYHSADTTVSTPTRDGKISLIELTRVIELYNYRAGSTRTGQYHVQAGTEDGFAPGP